MDKKQQALSLTVCPRRHAIAEQAPITRQTIEPFPEIGAGSQGVLDQVERAARQRLGEMNAESFVAGEGRSEAPRRLGHSLGDANVGIVEPRPPEKAANRRGVDAAALDPCDEVRQYPTLYGWRDDRTPSRGRTVRPSGWRPSPRTSSRVKGRHLASHFKGPEFRACLGTTASLDARNQDVVAVDVIDILRRDQMVPSEDRWRHRFAVQDIERQRDDLRTIVLREVRH